MHTSPRVQLPPRAKWTPETPDDRKIFLPLTGALLVGFLLGMPALTSAQEGAAPASVTRSDRTVLSGRVRHVGSARLFGLEDPSGKRPNRLVQVPRADAIPPEGTTVVVDGPLRPIEPADLTPGVDDAGNYDKETVVVARSVMLEDGSDLLRRPRPVARSLYQPTTGAGTRTSSETAVRATALANLIDDLAGQDVTVSSAKVVGVLNPRVFVIEPATSFQMMLGARDRTAVLIAGTAALRVDAATLVGSTVKVVGVARTALGLSVSREVSWPPELTRDYMRRLEIRAVLLATSVQSPEGVELTSGR